MQIIKRTCLECVYTTFSGGAKYCPKDGQMLQAVDIAKPCHRCGNLLFADYAYCSGCGIPRNAVLNEPWRLAARIKSLFAKPLDTTEAIPGSAKA